ncbi:TerC family protein [Halobacillus sp. Marseille-Q1614]|uniref:TerC family protein n=1 Tax=Halobacillus sp. Marseille-Q1614 TaxID=2709134 RepID=UPI00156F6D64|nr:TerC family protein [Halobacillus sp. Marseille-Q1614]
MDISLLMEYGWVLLILIGLEGILAADNALVIATMVKHLPEEKRKKALFYGLAGAFIFRFGSLFVISYLVHIWQVQAIGAIYLIGIAAYHLLKKHVLKPKVKEAKSVKKGSSFWGTVIKVELADIAFAVDSILAAVALAVTLPVTSMPEIGGMDGGHFAVILAGGIIGLVIMRFAASYFVGLIDRRPGLETAAYLIVAWVGVKLAVYTLAHPELAVLAEGFAKSVPWKITFWSVLLMIGVSGWFLSKEDKKVDTKKTAAQN